MKAHDRNLVLDFYIWVRDWKDSPLIPILTPRMEYAAIAGCLLVLTEHKLPHCCRQMKGSVI